MVSVQASKGSSRSVTPDRTLVSPSSQFPSQLQQPPNQMVELSHVDSHDDPQLVQHQLVTGSNAPMQDQTQAEQQHYRHQNLAMTNAGYAYVATPCSGAQVSTISFDELRPAMNIPANYGGPHKIVPAAPVERPLTDSERLRVEKEQFKLTLQNFRRTQKTAKQVQQAKQIAALQAQKTSSGINSTYQAFDLQNYKSPEDCFIGLQSAKKMLQSSAFYSGTSTSGLAAQKLATNGNSTLNQHQAQVYGKSNTGASVQKQHKQTHQIIGVPHKQSSGQQIVHHPPPPQARRKRGTDHYNLQIAENSGLLANGALIGAQPHPMMLRNTQGALRQAELPQSQLYGAGSGGGAARRQGRFNPQIYHHAQSQNQVLPQSAAKFSGSRLGQPQTQNIHPNLASVQSNAVNQRQTLRNDQENCQIVSPEDIAANKSSCHLPRAQDLTQQKSTFNESKAKPAASGNELRQTYKDSELEKPRTRIQQDLHQISQEEDEERQEATGQDVSRRVNVANLSAQLDKLAQCLNEPQSDICQLFQQKYEELMREHQLKLVKNKVSGQSSSSQAQSSSRLSEGQPKQPATTQHMLQQEPNLSLLFQLVQTDLLQRQASRVGGDQPVESEILAVKDTQHAKCDEEDFGRESETDVKVSSSDPITDLDMSISSTLAVISQEEAEHFDELYCDGNGILLISEDDEDGVEDDRASNSPLAAQDSNSARPSHEAHNDAVCVEYDEEEEEGDYGDNDDGCGGEIEGDADDVDDQMAEHHHEFMAQRTMGQYGGDQTEAYEEQPIQMLASPSDGQYHEFSQSDYVEAVEGFNAEEKDEDENEVDEQVEYEPTSVHNTQPNSIDELRYPNSGQYRQTRIRQGLQKQNNDSTQYYYSSHQGDTNQDIACHQPQTFNRRKRGNHGHQRGTKVTGHQTYGGAMPEPNEHQSVPKGERQKISRGQYYENAEIAVIEEEQKVFGEETEVDSAQHHESDCADQELDEDQYIEEEHQFALNHLYAQAHKQLLANGLGSNEDIQAWQALYPRLIGEGLTPQNLEQIINLGQANLTPAQAHQIFNLQKKQIADGLAANSVVDGQSMHNQPSRQTSNQHIRRYNNGEVDQEDDSNQYEVVDQENAVNQYEWCSQESDEESHYEECDERNDDAELHEHQDKHNVYDNQVSGNTGYSSAGGASYIEEVVDTSYSDQQTMILSTLQPPSHLSPGFKRFFSEFENNIDFILRWDYEILPEQLQPHVCKAKQKGLQKKYLNLLTASRDMCRRFTGPHSVLQIFLEKIVASINFIAESLKESTLKDLGLWIEVQVRIQKRKQAQCGSSLLIGHHKRSSSANPELLIKKTSNIGSNAQVAPTQDEEKPLESHQEEQLYETELKPKPIINNIEKYTQFLEDFRNQYLLIIKECAPKISKHFTKLTAVINENTQYEFPSEDIHKAVISKLILNDQKILKLLVQHIQAEFKEHEIVIRENYPAFVYALDLFMSEVKSDMRNNQTKIETYMRDLRKHALDEYEDLYRREQEAIKAGRNADGKKKRKKRKRKNKSGAAANGQTQDDQDTEEVDEEAAGNVQMSAERAIGVSQIEEIKIEGSQESAAQAPTGDLNVVNPEQTTKKSKRKRRNKKKGQDSVINELLNNLDTDDLVDFINNQGSKKEDLKKTAAHAKAQGDSQSKGQAAIRNSNESDDAKKRESEQKGNDDVNVNGSTCAINNNVSNQKANGPSNKQLSRKQRRSKQKAANQELEAVLKNEKESFQKQLNQFPAIKDYIEDSSGENLAKEDFGQENIDDEKFNYASDSSEAIFQENLKCLTQVLLRDSLAQEQTRVKMCPNVSSTWLSKVRERVRRTDERAEKRRASASQDRPQSTI